MNRYLAILTFATAACCPLAAQDTSLHDWLAENEPWKPAITGFSFTDGLCNDAKGDLYFSDVKTGKGIYHWNASTENPTLIVDNLPGISGLQIGPDGRFYACHNKEQRILAISRSGEVEVLLTGVKCNDLAVSKTGNLYFTETPTKRIHLIKADKSHVVADEGHVTRPNGIAISPDQLTLAVSDHGGKHVWTWVIQPDGSLAGAEPYMTMETPPEPDQSAGAKPGERPANLPLYKKEALGDGMTAESTGRWLVTTAVGIQVFDTAGRHAGTIDLPKPGAKVVSVEFGSLSFDTIFVAAGDTIWSRKLKIKGLAQ